MQRSMMVLESYTPVNVMSDVRQSQSKATVLV